MRCLRSLKRFPSRSELKNAAGEPVPEAIYNALKVDWQKNAKKTANTAKADQAETADS